MDFAEIPEEYSDCPPSVHSLRILNSPEIGYLNEKTTLDLTLATQRANGNPYQKVSLEIDEELALHPFSKLLIKETDSSKLISNFVKEKSCFSKSDASNVSFSLDSCVSRLKSGYTLIHFNIFQPVIQNVSMVLNTEHLNLEFPNQRSLKIPLKQIKGVLQGNKASGLQYFNNKICKLTTMGVESHMCFSVLTDFKTFDFASFSQTAIYDCLIVLNWLIYTSSRMNCTVPLTKRQITLYNVKNKIVNMAKERFLFPKELFLIAIIKTLVEMNQLEKAYKVKSILDRSFSASMKIYRTCTMMIPRSLKFKFRMNDSDKRLFVLRIKRANLLIQNTLNIRNLIQDWQELKGNIISLCNQSSLKKYLNLKRVNTHLNHKAI